MSLFYLNRTNIIKTLLFVVLLCMCKANNNMADNEDNVIELSDSSEDE